VPEEPPIPPNPDAEPAIPQKRGRGRPRKNPELVSDGAGSGDKPKPRRASRSRLSDAELTDLKGELAAQLVMVGMPLAMVAPVTGHTVIMRAEMASGAVVDLARKNAKVMRLLLKLTQVNAYATLGQAAACVVVAVGIDAGAVKPDSLPAQKLIPDVLEQFEIKPPEQTAEAVAA
jgi:hypothetical protein